MDFEFSADQEALRDSVRRYLADKAPINPYVRGQLDDDRGTSGAVWQGLVDLGVVGLLVPQAYGGAGMGLVDMGVVLYELGRAVHPGPFASSAVGAVGAFVEAGDDTDRERWLPSLANGTKVGTVALHELTGRGGWRQVAATARRGGDGWKLSGVKTPVPDGLAADVIVVSAVAEGQRGLYLVEADARGLEVSPLDGMDGTRKQATVTLDGTPALRLGGESSDASEAIAAVVDRLLAAMVTDAVGAAERALEIAVSYAKERVQFDKPIGSFQAVQHLCAEMLQSVEMARAGAYYALWAADAAPVEERHRAATMAKAFAGDALFRVGANTIQVLGGIGFTWEHDAHLYYKRLMSLQDAFGGTAEHLEELASLIV